MSKKSLLALVSAALLLTGCSTFWDWSGGGRNGTSSSLVDYLYPNGEVPPDIQDTIPHLELPLRVGIAFVPGQAGPGSISEATKMHLLEQVKSNFMDREYIAHIEVIPDTYLRSSNGVTGMQQVARLYSMDVMALVSYDQVAHSAETTSSFLYWTIVGAYVVKGNKNDVQTFVDTAVFDVATRKLLFRAPGVNEVKSSSTLVDVERDVRAAQQKSFELAMADMTVNLDKELSTFKERIKSDGSVRVTRVSGAEGGGGVADTNFLLLLTGLLLLSARLRQP